MSEKLARCVNPNLEDQVIFDQGFLPLALDKSISNCRTAVLVLVHPGYFISPVPTVSGERSSIRHLGLDTTGEKEKRASKKNVDWKSTSSHDNKKFRTRSMEKQRGMAFGFRKKATAVKKTGQIDRYINPPSFS